MNAKLVTKSVEATIEPVADEDAENPHGEFNVILATPGEDREGDDLTGKGWQLPLPDHITFDSDHGMNVKTLVGSGTPTLMPDGSIWVKGTYAPTAHAQEVRQLVNPPGRHIRTVSVTYLQRTTKSAGKSTTSRELLNGSFVAVPANPKAVVLSSKSLGGGADATPAQIAHDAAVQLGAACDDDQVTAKSIEVAIVTKGISGSVEDLSERVRKAVRELYRTDNRRYAYVRATFLDDSNKGTVVYDVEDYSGDLGGGTSKTMARDFSIDGTKVALGDSPREVSLVTSVVDDSDADQVSKSLSTSGDRSVDTDAVEQAIETLSKSMTRAAACELLGVADPSATVATSEGTAAVDSPAEDATAGNSRRVTKAVETDAAASAQAEQRYSALMQSLDAAAG